MKTTEPNINAGLVTAAHNAWSALGELRKRRERFKRYTYGDQWGDLVTDDSGRPVREGDLLGRTGTPPMTNNLIRRLVKTIVGRYRSISAEQHRYDTAAGSADAFNDMAELDSRLLEEFLISGCAIQRVSRDVRPAGSGVWVDNVSPGTFFTGPFSDPRGSDVEMVGMLHSMSLAQLLSRFGGGSAASVRRLRNILAAEGEAMLASATLAGADADFFSTATQGQYRVIEMWTLDAVTRPRTRFEWHCRWLTPGGELLAAYRSPYGHGRHPFVFKFYPYVDGEVHPFVEDVIDQQRYINRLVVLIDKMMGSTAKGVLLFPVNERVPGFSWEEICRRWSSTDGVIPIMGHDSGVRPQQVTSAGADAGAHKLLELELKLFEDISGVSDALLGKSTGGSGGQGLYESQVSNSTIALADIFQTFASLTVRRDNLIKNL